MRHRQTCAHYAYRAAYEKADGVGSVSTFGGHAWDAGHLLAQAIPVALKKAQPGTEAFRDALQSLKELLLAHGIMNARATDHNGFDDRARVIVQIVDSKWKPQRG